MEETDEAKTIEVIEAYLKAIQEGDETYIAATFTYKSKA